MITKSGARIFTTYAICDAFRRRWNKYILQRNKNPITLTKESLCEIETIRQRLPPALTRNSGCKNVVAHFDLFITVGLPSPKVKQ